MSLGTTSRLSGNQLENDRSSVCVVSLPVSGPISLLGVDVGSVSGRSEVAVVCNPIKMGRWSELMIVSVCHSDEVMRETDANDTSGELGSEFPGSFVGESVFRTAKVEMLTESASWLTLVSVVQECQSEW